MSLVTGNQGAKIGVAAEIAEGAPRGAATGAGQD